MCNRLVTTFAVRAMGAVGAVMCAAASGCWQRVLPVDPAPVGDASEPPGADASEDAGPPDSGVPLPTNACGGSVELAALGLPCGPCRVNACDGSDALRCSYQASEPDCPAFTDVTAESGLGGLPPVVLYENSGPGAAVADFDADGVLDIIYAGRDQALYYRGDPAGTFAFEQALGLGGITYDAGGNGAVAADLDDDADMDLLLTGPPVNRDITLWRNAGGFFDDVTDAAGLSNASIGGNGAAFGDYDGDGDLDLYVATFSQVDSSHLFRNDVGLFVDVTDAAGVALAGARSFQPVWLDYDTDGDFDLLVANDVPHVTLVPTTLFRNEGDGTFTDVGTLTGIAYWIDGMGLALGDPDLDGDVDVFVTNVPGVPIAGINNLFFVNQGDGTFFEESTPRGTSVPRWSWGDVFFDYDNDGDEDLFFAAEPWAIISDVGCVLLRNDGTGNFEDVSVVMGGDVETSTFGALAVDIEHDGDLDLLLTGRGGGPPMTLLLNNGTPGRWLEVTLDQPGRPNRSAIGATIVVEGGGRVQTRWLRAGESCHMGGPPVVHFGMGSAARADRVTVLWPDGATTTVENVALDQTLLVTRD